VEIHVTNAGPLRTVAEVRFYQSDGLGGAGVLAGTQTADLVPGGGRAFRSPEMPGGFLGWVGIWAFDADGPAGVYGKSALVAVVKTQARNAGGAWEANDGVPREEVVSPGQHITLPLAYRNYGGTANKWSSLLTAVNIGESAPVTFQFRSQDRIRNDARRCAISCVITRYVNRGGVLNLNLADNTDPDIALLGEGTYTVDIMLGGSAQPSAFAGDLPGWYRTTFPGGMIFSAIHLTVEGRMMMDGRAGNKLGTSAGIPAFDAENQGQMYAPLLFKNYNGWASGMVVSAAQTSGGLSAVATVTFYDEGGMFLGQINDRLSSSSSAFYLYLPAIDFLPDKFRGTAVINVTSAGGDAPGFGPGASANLLVAHVNYDRNAALSYDGIGMSAVVSRAEGAGELPCIAVGFVTCAWAADVVKTYTVSRSEVQVGPQTGIRIFNPDPLHTGVPATVVVHYLDDTGVIWNEATQVFSIPPYGVHTLFPMYDARLPEVFRGSMRLSASGNFIVGIGQTIDYAAVGFDAGGAYNLQYHSGRTR
jgi:hypothetical protein